MRREAPSTSLDPALAVSVLLTRLALFLMVIVAPMATIASRRAVSVLVPTAAILLVLATALSGRLPAALERLGRAALSPHGLAFLLFLVWAALSVVWTPHPSGASRFGTLAVTLLLYAGAVLCVPDRVRSSNVNLISIGVAIAAALLAFEASPLLPFAGENAADPNRQRAAIVITLLAWPALCLLFLKRRWLQASLLVAVLIGALWLARNLVVLSAFLSGSLAFALVAWRPRIGLAVTASATIALLILAPLIGWWVAEKGGFLLPAAGDRLAGIWRDVTFSLPTHLFAGYGFDASGALQRGPGGEILGSPRNAALQIWLELGLVGVAVAALALIMAWQAVARSADHLRAAIAAVVVSAATIMFCGLAAWQSWWLTTLGLVAIALTFVARWSAPRKMVVPAHRFRAFSSESLPPT